MAKYHIFGSEILSAETFTFKSSGVTLELLHFFGAGLLGYVFVYQFSSNTYLFHR